MYRLTTKPWQHTDSLPEFVFHEGKEKQRPSRLFLRSKTTEGKHYLKNHCAYPPVKHGERKKPKAEGRIKHFSNVLFG
jgi:hypothetical protein